MKILIVDDHPIVRKGISSALSFEKDVEKVLEASSLKEAMTLINAEKPELCIVDLYLGEEDGLELLKKAKYESGGVKFVILTSSLKKEDFIRAEEAGADGYILKDAFSEDILYAISVVLRGKKFIDPDIVRCQVETYEKLDCLKELTPREVEVLYELGKGLSNMEETALAINLKALEEIARQIKLRNISGIILIDFIDVKKEESLALITAKAKALFRDDKTKTAVVGMTKLNIMEIGERLKIIKIC